MKYISTRGEKKELGFVDCFLTGLASDGGLYVANQYPKFSKDEILSFKSLSYPELAFKIIYPFMEGQVPEEVVKDLLNKTYNQTSFLDKEIAPVKKLNDKHYLLELFHGPTAAFKDFALQFIGHLLQYVLQEKNEKAIIVGATSGDTGSAAIHGCMSCEAADIYILHPLNRVSDIQRRQMTTIKNKNVFNIAIEGTFDDCQHIVKEIFCDQGFIENKKRLIAVNSINWVRIIAQIVYYFYASLKVNQASEPISFSVPTGNFGDVFAGYLAKKMGLPIDKLIIATNQNDILSRMLNQNDYSIKPIHKTITPSMDIQISSNFERLLFFAYEGNSSKINDLMTSFKESKKLEIGNAALARIKEDFLASKSSDDEIAEIMKMLSNEFNEIIDPHTATGIKSAFEFQDQVNSKIITLATAHPGKFPEALKKSGLNLDKLPKSLENNSKEKFETIENSKEKVKNYIKKNSL